VGLLSVYSKLNKRKMFSLSLSLWLSLSPLVSFSLSRSLCQSYIKLVSLSFALSCSVSGHCVFVSHDVQTRRYIHDCKFGYPPGKSSVFVIKFSWKKHNSFSKQVSNVRQTRTESVHKTYFSLSLSLLLKTYFSLSLSHKYVL
jgi:hypothetical protein